MKRFIIRKFDLLFFTAVLLLVLLLAMAARAQTEENAGLQSSGGNFTMTKTVIAGGGRELSQSPSLLNGTSGQAAAGVKSLGGSFTLYSGFWTPEDLAPTAAEVVAGGRIKTADGRGIRSVRVTITFPTGETRSTLSSTLGYYSFINIPAGETYVIGVAAKRYVFAPPVQVRTLAEDVTDIDFVADALP